MSHPIASHLFPTPGEGDPPDLRPAVSQRPVATAGAIEGKETPDAALLHPLRGDATLRVRTRPRGRWRHYPDREVMTVDDDW
jgi:hypothetical protein